MKIKFDGDQPFQRDAVAAIVDVFAGQPLLATPPPQSDLPGELGGAGNLLLLADDTLLENVRAVQARHELPAQDALAGRNFSVEMETGTGKTYVYLRSLFELNARYGWTKFVIVTPGVAVREGVLQTIAQTRDHFGTLYPGVPVVARAYHSGQVSRLREFAAATDLHILVMNLDAFNKDSNVIARENDRLGGRRPLEFLQASRPVVVLDEPQNMESAASRAAVAGLHPLCTLRYSATHRDPYNLVYRLDPMRAYDLGLVKRIEVDSVVEESDVNRPFLRVVKIASTRTRIAATIEMDVQTASGALVRKTQTIINAGTDLFTLSGGRAPYQGYVVDDIRRPDAQNGWVAFANGVTVRAGETHGAPRTDDMMAVQIRQTVRRHLDKEHEIARLPPGERLKVLSLFFIDRVANYAPPDGKIRRAFEAAYAEIASEEKYRALDLPPVSAVHDGYFAREKGVAKDSGERATRADDEAYALIIRDKERLLSRDTPLRFLFSHTALGEGWDNPNVFQICTLNELHSVVRKRQQIGRGLRLPVRENGERSFDPVLNRLTVVANESFADFARDLQTQIEEETGVRFDNNRIKNARARRVAVLKPGWRDDPDFLALWDRIKHKTRYRVNFRTDDLIARATDELKKMLPARTAPRYRVESHTLNLDKSGVTGRPGGSAAERETSQTNYQIGGTLSVPDLVGYLQKRTELTRATLAQVLIRSGRLNEAARNPQQFLDDALIALRKTWADLMIEGIQYERIRGGADAEYDLRLFEEQEIAGYRDRMRDVNRSLYDVIAYDSPAEEAFARALDARDDIKLFLKLPRWFRIETPLSGAYTPAGWVIVYQRRAGEAEPRLLVCCLQTDALNDDSPKTRPCAAAHFAVLGVEYRSVSGAHDV